MCDGGEGAGESGGGLSGTASSSDEVEDGERWCGGGAAIGCVRDDGEPRESLPSAAALGIKAGDDGTRRRGGDGAAVGTGGDGGGELGGSARIATGIAADKDDVVDVGVASAAVVEADRERPSNNGERGAAAALADGREADGDGGTRS